MGGRDRRAPARQPVADGHPFTGLQRALRGSEAGARLELCPEENTEARTLLPGAALGACSTIRHLLDQLCLAHGIRHRPAGAVSLLSAVAYGTVTPAAFGLYVLHRVADPSPENLCFPADLEAVRFERPMLRRPVTAVVGESGDPDTVAVDDVAALEDWTARRLVATLAPMVAALRRVSRVGPRTLWSFVADSVHFTMLLAATERGQQPQDAWHWARRLVRSMAAVAPGMSARPRAFPVRGPGLDTLWLVRGACCFAYREPASRRFCATCPLIDDCERHNRLERWFIASGRG